MNFIPLQYRGWGVIIITFLLWYWFYNCSLSIIESLLLQNWY